MSSLNDIGEKRNQKYIKVEFFCKLNLLGLGEKQNNFSTSPKKTKVKEVMKKQACEKWEL